jgi:signal peptidase I
MMSSQPENPPAGLQLRQRKARYALLLVLFVGMGAGQLYSGNSRRAMAAAVLFVSALLLIPASAAVPPDSAPGLLFGAALAAGSALILLSIVVDAGLGARRTRSIPETRLYPVRVYALLFLGSVAAHVLMVIAGHTAINRSMYAISGIGMAPPALRPDDYVFGYRGFYADHAVQRGDVVIFDIVAGRPYVGRKKSAVSSIVKRVVGLPGETIQISGGVLYIDGVAVERNLIQHLKIRPSPTSTTFLIPQYIETLPSGESYRILEWDGDRGRGDNTGRFVVPAGHVFVLGDNRDVSDDSRQIGPVPLEALTDRVEIVFWSQELARIGLWLHPD